MIVLLIIGFWPYKKLEQFPDPTVSLLHFNLYYILLLLSLRLLRFILRFISNLILMLSAIISWLCRKKVTKGRSLEMPMMIRQPSSGILLVDLDQPNARKKRGGQDTPRFDRVRNNNNNHSYFIE